MQENVSETLFLHVKQRLDHHHLPTQFPIAATPLLSLLLKRIDNCSTNNANNNKNGLEVQDPHTLAALRHSMGNVIKENNALHMQLISANQHIATLKHSIRTTTKQPPLPPTPNNTHLLHQIAQITFKYNELIDLIHGDNTLDRPYLKRLIKLQHQDHSTNVVGNRSSNNTINNGTINNGTINNGTIQNGTHDHLCEMKILNREKEIKRLQSLLEYNGININRILKEYNDAMSLKHNTNTQNTITQLQLQNHQLSSEYRINKHGSKQALQSQLSSNKQTINRLLQEKKQLKKIIKDKQYDREIKQKQHHHKISILKEEEQKHKSIHKKLQIEKNKIQQQYRDVKENLTQQINKCKEQNQYMIKHSQQRYKQYDEKCIRYEYQLKDAVGRRDEQISVLRYRYQECIRQLTQLKKQQHTTMKNEALLRQNATLLQQLNSVSSSILPLNNTIFTLQTQIHQHNSTQQSLLHQQQLNQILISQLQSSKQRVISELNHLTTLQHQQQQQYTTHTQSLQLLLYKKDEQHHALLTKYQTLKLKLSDHTRITNTNNTNNTPDNDLTKDKEIITLDVKCKELITQCQEIKEECSKREERINQAWEKEITLLKRENNRLTDCLAREKNRNQEQYRLLCNVRKDKEIISLERDAAVIHNLHLTKKQ